MNATATPPSARPPQNPAPRRRWLRRTAIASACVLGLWGVLWLGAPPLIRSQGEKIATNVLGRQVRIGEVKLHPWSLELELRDLSMAGAEPGSAPQLSIARAYVDADMSSLWRLAPVLDAIEIDQPVVRLAHLGEGKLDIADIIARFPPDPNKPDDGKPARLALYNIAITDGRFEFENVPSGGKHVVSDLQLALPFISTLASQRQIRVTPRLSFALDGSRFDTQAHALPFDDSRHTEAALRLAQLDLAPYLPYLPDGLPVRPVAGIADADLRLRFDQSGATPALSIDGTLALSGVKVKDAQEQDAIALERLDVTLQDTRPLERHIHLSQVALTKPDVLLARDARGRINLAATGAAPAKAKAKPAAPAASVASEALPAEAPASQASAAETPAAPAPESAASAPEVTDTTALAASSPASSAGNIIDTPSETAPAASEAASAAPAAAPAKAASTRKKATQTKRRTTRKKTVKKKSAALLDALIPAAHAQESEAPAPEAAETPDTATLAASSPASSAGDDIDTPQETASSAPAASAEASASAPEAALQAASEPAPEPALDTEPASAPQAPPQTTPPKAPKASAAAKRASNAAAASTGEQADWTVQVEQITIADGHLEWRDAQPAASLHANGLTVAARAFTWPLNEPMEFEGSLAVSAPGVATKRAATPQEEAAPQEDVAPAVEPASAAEPAAQPAAQPAAKKKAAKRRATKKKAGTKKKSAALLDALIPAAHAQQASDAASAPQAPEIADTAAFSTSSPASYAGDAIDTPSEAASAASEAASESASEAAPASAASEAASDASAAEAIAAAPLAPELHESADAAAAAREAAAALAVPGEAFKRASGAQTLRFRGKATMKSAQVQAEASNIALALARAYIAPFIKGDIDGNANAHASVQWSAPDALRVNADTITLSHLSLSGEGIAAPVAGQQAAPAAANRAQSAAAPAASATRRDPASPLDHARSGPLVAIERINVEGAALDLTARSVDVQRLAVAAPRAAVLRYADGHLMVQDWLRGSGTAPAASDAVPQETAPQEEAPKEKKSTSGTPWSVRLHDAQVQGGLIAWRDAVPTRPVRADLGDVSLKAQGIHWDGAKLAGNMPVELTAQMTAAGRRTEPGRLAWNGKVAIEPLAVQGNITAERLPAHAFMPYAGSSLNLDVLRADASFKGSVNVAQQSAGLSLAVQGDARLQELRAHSLPGSTRQRKATRTASQAPLAPDAAAERRASGLGEELLSLKNLRVQSVDVQMQPRRPLRVSTGQTTLSDFFARLVILPDGRFSLRDIVGEGEEVPPAAPQAAASAASAAAPAPQRRDPNAPIINIGPVRVSSGRVAFTDRFIRPNYSADLSELQGTLGAFSTAPTAGGEVQMAELKLTGRAQGTALLDISGQLNPLAKPLALDIHGRATDLELPPLSPYSVKYAGHGIERGKLSMDVNYKVQPDGMLTADNKIILNQLEFGEPVEGAPNSLPVKLATALLADSNGVINLDIPVSGSLNDPNFSIAPVIFKAVSSIVTGIVTAPFKVIAAALGGSGSAGDPSHVLFASGSSVLSDTARTQLDAVAKLLKERTQLKLTISGAAQLDSEREGWQRQRLRDMLAAELRGDAPAEQRGDEDEGDAAQGDSEGKKPAPPRVTTSADAATEAALAKLDADGYARLLRRLYRRADLPDKPRNALGMARSLPVEEMEKLLMAQIEADDDAMRSLAQARAAAIKDYLATKGLDGNRLFLGSSRTSAPKADAKASAASAAAPAGQLTGAVLSLSTK